MRVLRLVDVDDFAVEFHPYITVVAGTSDAQRSAIVEAFGEAAVGRTTALEGLIEVHGVVLDLDDRALALLELDDADVDVVVTANDLLGSASGDVGRQIVAVERHLEALEQPHRDRVDALTEAEDALAAAQSAEEVARRRAEQETGHEVTAGPAAADASRSDLVERRAALQLERDRLFAALDPGAGPALDDALGALDRATEEASQASAPAEADEPTATAAPDVDPDRLDELRTALSLVRLSDPVPVREALEEVRAGHVIGETVPSTEALSLADRLEQLDRTIADLDGEAAAAPSNDDMDEAIEAVEQARLAVAECERSRSAPGSGGEDDIAALERAHADVERARDGLDTLFGRAKAQRHLQEAVETENVLLERLGLQSYTEFLTDGGSVRPVRDEDPRLEAARVRLAETESALAALEHRVAAALEHAAAVDERRLARDEARSLLDAPDLADAAVPTALLDLRVPADDAISIAQLVDALAGVGLRVGDLDLSSVEIETIAADWLTEQQHAETRLKRQIEELAGGPRATPPAGTTDSGLADGGDLLAPGDPVADAEEAVQAAKARVVAHETAAAALSVAEASLAEVETTLADAPEADATATSDPSGTGSDAPSDPDATQSLDAAIDAVAAARAAVEEAVGAVEASGEEYDRAVEELAVLRQNVVDLDDEPPAVDEIEWYLLARLAAQRQQSFVGSLPLVIAAALDGVADDDGLDHLLDRLERTAGAVQIVHISDDPRIVSWATALSDDRAAVVSPVEARPTDS